jgi:MFS family permease
VRPVAGSRETTTSSPHTFTQVRSYERSVQLLMVNQFTINLGFYMLMPYLAAHLSGTLGLAGWVVGLVLGVRNFSQQGMFLVGGTLADRFGHKPLIVAGCVLRTLGFATLGLVDSLAALIAASAATGLAGALFNPAVRAYLAADAGERRVEAFALFNVFCQAGILLGPLVGMVLTGVDFRVTCLVSAGIFAVLSNVQIRALPTRRADDSKAKESDRGRVLAQWRGILANRPFLLFSGAMIGSYVLTFQVYLALPLEVRRVGGDGEFGTAAVAGLFAVSGLSTILGRTRVTAWCKARYEPGQALTRGLAAMGLAFVPLLLSAVLPVPDSGVDEFDALGGHVGNCRRSTAVPTPDNGAQPPRRTCAALRASASLRASPDFRDLPPVAREASLLVPSPRKGALVFLGRGTAGPRSSGVPEGALAPVIRLSSASPERTLVTVGSMPASAITRLVSRRWPDSTKVTTFPDSPARAVRPARCR